jgi:acetyltransferase-like isoleucine patch superfamily enzyme
MQIYTEDDYMGVLPDHPSAKHFTVLAFKDGSTTVIPHNFFRNWLDEEAQTGNFYIGRCSGLGVGSVVKYDAGQQSLALGRFVAGGLRLKFLLNGQHDMRTISTYMFSVLGMGMQNVPPPQYRDSIVKNDVWLGDEMMMLGGGIIENGCVIGARAVLPPNFRSEPYGIYVGSPARLVRFRFSEKVCAALTALAWWEMPMSWIRDNNAMFLQDMTSDEALALDIIARLAESRKEFEAAAQQP